MGTARRLRLVARASLLALLAGLLQLVTVAPASAVIPDGNLDTISSPTAGRIHVSGWAKDLDTPDAGVSIHVYVGDYGTDLGPATLYRADVGSHGFDASIDLPVVGDLDYIVYAIDTGAEGPRVIGQGRIFVADASVNGAVESISSTVHKTIDVSGWASDPNSTSTPVRIEVYVGGNWDTPGVEGTALSAATPRGELLAFSGRLTTAKTGTQPVYVWAKNLPGTPGNDRLLGQFSVTIFEDKTPPQTTITSAPDTATTDDLIEVKFTSNEANSTFKCQWDLEQVFDCAGGTSVKLTAGKHKFAVQATDAYGNEATPVWHFITVTQAPTPTNPNAPTPTNPGTQTHTGRSIVAKAVKKKSRLRINVGPDSATTNYRIIVQRKVGKKWRKITRTRTRGPKDIVTINLKRGKYRAVLPKSSAGKALRSNTIRLKR